MKDEVYQLAEVFKALGDPTRLKLIKILASDMVSDIRITDIAEMLGITQPAVSQHLKVLKGVGILESHKEGYRVYYNIDKETFYKHKQLIDNMFVMAFKKCDEK
jgi:ArsR family transcriptional regulator